MKKLLAGVAIGALLASGVAYAAEIFGDGAAFSGHVVTQNGAGNPAPAVANCTLVAGSTDAAGQCAATATSGVAVTFGKAFATTPSCIVFDRTTSTGNQLATPVSTTGFTLGTTAAADVVNWICFGKQGN